MITVNARVKIVNSADNRIEGWRATIVGRYGAAFIILFDCKPDGYDPAIVAVAEILELI